MPTEEVRSLTTNNNEVDFNTNNDNGRATILDLPPKVQRFVHLYMTGHYTLTALAELLEVHVNTLHSWLKRKNVKDVISDMQETTHVVVGNQLKVMSNVAVAKLLKLMDSPIDGVALQAVRDVLDRAGHRPKQEIKVDKTVITYEEKLRDLIDDVINVTEYDVVEEEEHE